MAYYRASKVIKMRRNALGHSREEYSAEGPSDRTIFRMENGQVHIKESTYRRLSRAMDEEESTRQGILETEDMSVLGRINSINQCLYARNYEEAEILIQQMEDKLDLLSERNRRYLEYIKADLMYYRDGSESEAYKTAIEKNLSHGGKELDFLLEHKWPFKERECSMLLSLVEFERKEKNYERQKELLERLLDILDMEYMESSFNGVYQIIVRYRLGDVLGNLGFYREAIALDEKTIKMCEDENMLPKLYYDIFWNYMKIEEKETLTEQEEFYCKECLLKAYYFGKAIYPNITLYERRMREFYPDELLFKV